MSVDLQPTLRGALVELRPLRLTDWDALYDVASDPLLWEQHPESNRYEADVFREFFQRAIDSRSAFGVIDLSTDRIVGSSRYHGHDPVAREIEIGWSFLARSHWGGRYNGEMKQLMLEHAFTFVDRVIFSVGAKNIRSRRALERIGGELLDAHPACSPGILVFAIRKPAIPKQEADEDIKD